MTYLVLARKWRPRSFDTLVGQEHVVRALTHALSTQRLHHAWLFTGTRGVGKTTLSRILAKSLNCETGITPTPCGKCQACTEIDAGRFVDYLELDAASNRGVDEMTQLLEQAVYSPTSGRFKVYMIDEVHMLTGHAFNAMLKTLEEPPPHVKFILATTDPQKIPVTVLSRCLQFNLKQMPPESIVGHLDQVLQQEHLPFETGALRLISQAARGSMRDALSLTDQAIAYSAGNLSEEAVRGMLGTIDQRHLVRLLDAIQAADGPGVVAVADELSARSLSYAGALADLAVLLSRIALAQRIAGAVSEDDPLLADIARLADLFSADEVQLFYSIAVHSRAELPLAPDEYAGFVMACLRMLAFTAEAATDGAAPPVRPPAPRSAPLRAPAAMVQARSPVAAPRSVDRGGSHDAPTPGRAAAAALSALAQRGGSSAPAAAAASPVATPPTGVIEAVAVPERVSRADESIAKPAEQNLAPPLTVAAAPSPTSTQSVSSPVANPAPAAVVAPQDTRTEPRLDVPQPELEPDSGSLVQASVQASAQVSGREAASALGEPASASLPVGDITLSEPWATLAARLPIRGIAAQLAQQSEWVGVDGNTIVLRVATRGLSEGPSVERLRLVLEQHFGVVLRLRFEIGKTGDNTAHALAQSERQARQRAAEQAIMADPFVRDLLDNCGGQVVPDSIRPVNAEPKQGNQS